MCDRDAGVWVVGPGTYYRRQDDEFWVQGCTSLSVVFYSESDDCCRGLDWSCLEPCYEILDKSGLEVYVVEGFGLCLGSCCFWLVDSEDAITKYAMYLESGVASTILCPNLRTVTVGVYDGSPVVWFSDLDSWAARTTVCRWFCMHTSSAFPSTGRRRGSWLKCRVTDQLRNRTSCLSVYSSWPCRWIPF